MLMLSSKLAQFGKIPYFSVLEIVGLPNTIVHVLTLMVMNRHGKASCFSLVYSMIVTLAVSLNIV